MPSRADVQARSATLLIYLRRLPAAVVAIGVAALLLGGLLTHGSIAGVLLLILALFAGWLCFLSWPTAAPPARVARVIIIAAILALAVVRTLN